MYIGLHVKYRYSWPIVMELEFSRQILENTQVFNSNENPSFGSRVVACGQTDGRTDMAKLTVAFRNFANSPKNVRKPITFAACQGRCFGNIPDHILSHLTILLLQHAPSQGYGTL